MKKLIALLLSLLLTVSACAAFAEAVETEESAPLTKEELEIYLDSLAAAALEDENLLLTSYDDGSSFAEFSGGILQIADEQLTDSTAILSASLYKDQPDPRGLRLGATLDEVLAAYPNDNPLLSGSYYDAVLSIGGDKPEMTVGYLLRDGQRVGTIAYSVYSWQPDGVEIWGVYYTLNQGIVTGIFAGSSGVMAEEDALEELHGISEMQEISGYFAYPSSMDDGEGLAPFQREDLNLVRFGETVADFLDLDADAMIAAFGPAPVDEWTEDSDGSFLRLAQWNGISLLLNYDAQKQFTGVDTLTINDDVLDGPRGVRVGDTLDSVIFRFRHGDTFVDGSTLSLYGDGQAAPYGTLNYSPESAELSYAFDLEDGRSIVWHNTFVAGILQSMSLLLR